MVQLEKFSILLCLAAVILVYIIVLSLNYNYVIGTTEKGFNASSGSEPYTNGKIGVTLERPSDWKPVILKNGFQLVKEKDKIYVEIRRNNLESQDTQLGKYVDSDIKDRNSSREQFQLLNKSQSTISGNLSDYIAIYTFLKTKNQKDFSAEGKTEKILRIWTFSHGKVYTVAYVAEQDKFDSYLPVADKIIKSFKINDLGKSSNVIGAKSGLVKTNPKSENNTFEEINKKYLDQGRAVNKTFAISNESLITAGAKKTQSGQSNNLTLSNEGEYQTYENSTVGIKTRYPSNWNVEEHADSLRFVSPKVNTDDKYSQSVDLFAYPSMPLSKAVDSLSSYYNSSLSNFSITGSPHTSVGANSSSISILYSFNEQNIGPLRAMDFIVSPDGSNKTYLFTFRDEALKFNRDLPDAQKLINSTKFLK